MAHSIPDSTTDGLRDHFLIAMPSLQDGYFGHTVTYICEHGDDGAMGLVINQPIDLTLEQMLRQLDLDPASAMTEQTVFRGGPVQPEHGFVLHSPEKEWNGTRNLSDGLSLTTSRDILEAMALGEGPAQTLIALGYAGWGPGQLESEIAENAWLVAPASPSILFALPPYERWNAAAQLIGIDMNLISQVAGHA
ncbi:YqgE/AlgH family protein [Thioalkalivibrio sp.]|uniref:YqgE/AlgH family protein n=1 Tax=Thioalkalivibrio sp. TaxID=2093813 RepID=UPI0012D59C13|nr:YqgE/AlgH family protein [Thioalkalivibrio sp.]TVP80989.1 MAG: YqgE/AlgH family protein [Thioalkalivibrio sp.]